MPPDWPGSDAASDSFTGASAASRTAFDSGWSGNRASRKPTMRLTRTPSLANQSTASSPISGFHTLPSFASHTSFPFTFLVRGTELWCRATTSHELLNVGDPDDPPTVSVWYHRNGLLSSYLSSLFSRTHTCFRSPPGCWMMLRYSPTNAFPGAGLSRSQPNPSSGWSFVEAGSTCTSAMSSDSSMIGGGSRRKANSTGSRSAPRTSRSYPNWTELPRTRSALSSTCRLVSSTPGATRKPVPYPTVRPPSRMTTRPTDRARIAPIAR
jgi:hypothetical protein